MPRLAGTDTFKGRLWKYALNNADFVQCTWYGTQKLLNEIVKKDHIIIYPWGLHCDYFKNEYSELSEIASTFVNKLPENKVKFFYPKSITFASDHNAVVEAVDILIKNSITCFVVYFWMGNILDKHKEAELIKKIEQLKLSEYIRIEKHDYISYNDIKYIWSKMDVGLQIAIYDQFSTTVIEPLLMGKELIITDIEPYRKLNSLHSEINLKLIKPDALSISREMEYYIEGNRTKESTIQFRKQLIEEEFNFNRNIEKILSFFRSQISEKS